MDAIVRARIMGPDDAAQLFRRGVQGITVEGLLVLGLGRDRCITGVAMNPRHRALATVKVWELAVLRDELGAEALVLARFPTGRARAPSVSEARRFLDLAERAARARVILLDCIVMRSHQWWSLAERATGGSS
jgi:hypothetical protein